MLTEAQVRRYSPQSGLRDMTIAEKEVVLTFLLQVLSEHGILDRLAFKGGTCLRKMFIGGQGRFSKNLDFTGGLRQLLLQFLAGSRARRLKGVVLEECVTVEEMDLLSVRLCREVEDVGAGPAETDDRDLIELQFGRNDIDFGSARCCVDVVVTSKGGREGTCIRGEECALAVRSGNRRAQPIRN
jgi:hypothetical protein